MDGILGVEGLGIGMLGLGLPTVETQVEENMVNVIEKGFCREVYG